MFSTGESKTYKLKQPLNFKNQKFTLYECEQEHYHGKRYYMMARGLNLFCWANLIKNIYRLRLFRTLLWCIPTLFTQNAVVGFKDHYNTFVTRIELRDDGCNADLTFLSGKTVTFPNSQFSASPQSDYESNIKRFGRVGTSLFPLRVGQKLLMIDKDGRIEHEDVFKALCNGKIIDLSVMHDSKGQSNIIDI